MKQLKKHQLWSVYFEGPIIEVAENIFKMAEGNEEYQNLRIEEVPEFEGGYRHYLCGDKLETDFEEALREKQENEYKERQVEYERRQYEALKAKFEKN